MGYGRQAAQMATEYRTMRALEEANRLKREERGEEAPLEKSLTRSQAWATRMLDKLFGIR